jgi:DNA-binding transcriptional LysR family regulator
LRAQPFVLFARSVSPDYHERVLSICVQAGFLPEIRHEVRHWLAVVSMVSQGLGVALVPQAMQRCALRGAVFRPLEGASTPSEAYGVWLSGCRNVLVTRLLDDAAFGLEQRRRSPAPT